MAGAVRQWLLAGADAGAHAITLVDLGSLPEVEHCRRWTAPVAWHGSIIEQYCQKRGVGKQSVHRSAQHIAARAGAPWRALIEQCTAICTGWIEVVYNLYTAPVVRQLYNLYPTLYPTPWVGHWVVGTDGSWYIAVGT